MASSLKATPPPHRPKLSPTAQTGLKKDHPVSLLSLAICVDGEGRVEVRGWEGGAGLFWNCV